MLIAIAGPYSAQTEEQRKINLDKLNLIAAEIYKKGHIPLIGVNAALFVVEKLEEVNRYEAMMNISLTLVEKCDALFFTGESPGANLEKVLMETKGKKIYYNLNDIPYNNNKK